MVNIFLPAICSNCNKSLQSGHKIICTPCYDSLSKITLEQKSAFLERVQHNYFDDIYIMFEFSELFQTLMHQFKYEGYTHIAKLFAETINNSVTRMYEIVTAVPLHHTKKRERGFNQSALIAYYYSKLRNTPFSDKTIVREKYTVSQTKLDRKSRHTNMKNAFLISENVENKDILLIDDVITTGATLNECARVLKEAKCKRVDILSMATPVNILQSDLETSTQNQLIII